MGFSDLENGGFLLVIRMVGTDADGAGINSTRSEIVMFTWPCQTLFQHLRSFSIILLALANARILPTLR